MKKIREKIASVKYLITWRTVSGVVQYVETLKSRSRGVRSAAEGGRPSRKTNFSSKISIEKNYKSTLSSFRFDWILFF